MSVVIRSSCVLVFCLLSVSNTGTHAQIVTTAEITSHIVVRSTGTAPVPEIDTRRLVARSNNIEVPIVRVAESAPLSLVVMVDVTRSVSDAMASFVWDGQGRQTDARPSGAKPPDSPSDLFLRPLLRGLLPALRPNDRVRLGRITNVPELYPTFVTDRSELARAARWAVDPPADSRYGNSPIWDAIDTALSALESEVGRRRAILLVTDGLSTGNRIGLDAVTARAAYADVALFVIGEFWGVPRSARGWTLRDSTDGPWFVMTGAFTSPFDQLKGLARSTGGVFIADGLKGAPDPERALLAVMDLLRSGYAVTTLSPLLPGETGALAITINDPAVEIHVRDRYRR